MHVHLVLFVFFSLFVDQGRLYFCLSFMRLLSSPYILQDEKELLENQCCPTHLKPCVARKEDNYFFALSKYQKQLEETLTQNPDFVQPSFRLNEVRQYVLLFFVLLYSSFIIHFGCNILYDTDLFTVFSYKLP